MSRFLKRGILVVLLPGLLGMGTFSVNPQEVPMPEDNFKVKVTDDLGIVTEVKHFTCDGDTSVAAERGKAHLRIPLGNIQRVKVSAEDSSTMEKVEIQVTLNEGTTLTAIGMAKQRCQGITILGNYSIKFSEIRSIEVIALERAKPLNGGEFPPTN
ncbi:MAG: hypothetical protein HY538_07995 [Deltaproteobacteria bacterium]|nr:hypothetical protein [Deltaproteobacteria bacterium]